MKQEVQVDLCSWCERIVQSAGWLIVEERFADTTVPTMHHKFCSHIHLAKWAVQTIRDVQ